MLSLLLLPLLLLLVPLSGLPLATTGTRSLVLEEATSAAQDGWLARSYEDCSTRRLVSTNHWDCSTRRLVCRSYRDYSTSLLVSRSYRDYSTSLLVSRRFRNCNLCLCCVNSFCLSQAELFCQTTSSCSTFRGQQDYISKHVRLGLSRVFVTLALKDQELHVATAEASAKHVRL